MYPGAEDSKRRRRHAGRGGKTALAGTGSESHGSSNMSNMRLLEGGLRHPEGEPARDQTGDSAGGPQPGDGAVASWALQLLLDEVKRAYADLDPNRAELLLQKIEARQRIGARGWLTRVMHMLVFWAAAIAGSRAFRMLTL